MSRGIDMMTLGPMRNDDKSGMLPRDRIRAFPFRDKASYRHSISVKAVSSTGCQHG
jgi:hypothetical protein